MADVSKSISWSGYNISTSTSPSGTRDIYDFAPNSGQSPGIRVTGTVAITKAGNSILITPKIQMRRYGTASSDVVNYHVSRNYATADGSGDWTSFNSNYSNSPQYLSDSDKTVITWKQSIINLDDFSGGISFSGYWKLSCNVRKEVGNSSQNNTLNITLQIVNFTATGTKIPKYTVIFYDTLRKKPKPLSTIYNYNTKQAEVTVPSSPGDYVDTDPQNITVSFNYNGGSGSPSSKTMSRTVTTTTPFINWGGYSPDLKIVITYDRTINSNYGSSNTNYGQWSPSYITLPTATKEHYTLNGWYSNSTFVGKGGQSYTPSQSITLTAKWDPINYTVTFDKNTLQSVSETKRSIAYNSNIGTLPTAYPSSASTAYSKVWNEKWYKTFKDTAPGGSSVINANTVVTGNMTVYAGWLNVYKVAYNLNGKPGAAVPTTQAKTQNSPLTLVPSTDSSVKSWTSSEQTVKYDFMGGSYFGGTAPTIPKATVTNTFAGWLSSSDKETYCGKNQKTEYELNKATTMTAQWTKTYSVTIKLPKIAKRLGYNFMGWCKNKDGTGTRYSADSEQLFTEQSVTLYAIWEPVKNTLKLNFYDKDNSLKTYTKTYTINDNNFTIGIPQTTWNPKYVPWGNDYGFLGWASAEKTINSTVKINEWKSVKGVYENITKAPGYNPDSRENDLKTLTFTPKSYSEGSQWGEKNPKDTEAKSNSYGGVTANYYCCWTVSGKYVKIGGVWRRIVASYIKVDDDWRVISKAYFKASNSGSNPWRKEIGQK